MKVVRLLLILIVGLGVSLGANASSKAKTSSVAPVLLEKAIVAPIDKIAAPVYAEKELASSCSSKNKCNKDDKYDDDRDNKCEKRDKHGKCEHGEKPHHSKGCGDQLKPLFDKFGPGIPCVLVGMDKRFEDMMKKFEEFKSSIEMKFLLMQISIDALAAQDKELFAKIESLEEKIAELESCCNCGDPDPVCTDEDVRVIEKAMPPLESQVKEAVDMSLHFTEMYLSLAKGYDERLFREVDAKARDINTTYVDKVEPKLKEVNAIIDKSAGCAEIAVYEDPAIAEKIEITQADIAKADKDLATWKDQKLAQTVIAKGAVVGEVLKAMDKLTGEEVAPGSCDSANASKIIETTKVIEDISKNAIDSLAVSANEAYLKGDTVRLASIREELQKVHDNKLHTLKAFATGEIAGCEKEAEALKALYYATSDKLFALRDQIDAWLKPPDMQK